MSHITPHESDAEFLTPEDVAQDVSALTTTLLEKKTQKLVRALLQRSEIYAMLQDIVAAGRFANKAEALDHAIRTLHFALRIESRAA